MGCLTETKPEILRPQGDTTAYTIQGRLNSRCRTMLWRNGAHTGPTVSYMQTFDCPEGQHP